MADTRPDFVRPAEHYGDVTLSIQASEYHYCKPRRGDSTIPLEHYESVEIALWWSGDKRARRKWITCPSTELGITGFDDLWDGGDVAGWVPLRRVGELQVALGARARRLA